MLGTTLKRDRNACGHGCCNWTPAPSRRRTRNQRTRENRAWRRELANNPH